jgi:hypothetical protein
MAAEHALGTVQGTTDFMAGALAHRIGAEIAQMAELAVALQDTLAGFVADAAADRQAIREVQSLDRLTQVLQDLTRVMAALAQGLPQDLRVAAPPVLRVIRLYDLSQTLAAPDPREAVSVAGAEGEVAWL